VSVDDARVAGRRRSSRADERVENRARGVEVGDDGSHFEPAGAARAGRSGRLVQTASGDRGDARDDALRRSDDVGDKDGPIDRVAIVGLGSQTHCVDMNARYIQLDFAGGREPGGSVTIYGPLDKHTAPPGPYMLFLMHEIDGWMVPSVAKTIYVR
jgi:hypothetical protein